ncbi:prepilin-type N-terminal cleavage/methylation domain-containing protein [bacterium]|jgi:prepilin-type N-terminal cleavage/methylation domain-containing protein|nr:prepilin-type N-terminal cleavage/methylation domain-containing protein [bacterium]
MKKNKGFTLIELIVVIVILGIIGLVAIPKYYDMSSTAKENALKGQLGTIRSALSLYYSNQALTTGTAAYPSTLTGTLFAEGEVPEDPYISASAVITPAATPIAVGDIDNAGGWIYDSSTGEVRANVTGKIAL